MIRPYRVLGTGSRNWTDRPTIYRALSYALQDMPPDCGPMVVVHGAGDGGNNGEPGADSIIRDWARMMAAETSRVAGDEPHPADWDHCRATCFHAPRFRRNGKLYCPAAGPYRNQDMVDLGAAVCLAWPLADSRGTWNCVDCARKAGIPVRIVPEHWDGDVEWWDSAAG